MDSCYEQAASEHHSYPTTESVVKKDDNTMDSCDQELMAQTHAFLLRFDAPKHARPMLFLKTKAVTKIVHTSSCRLRALGQRASPVEDPQHIINKPSENADPAQHLINEPAQPTCRAKAFDLMSQPSEHAAPS
jgi:hypothetical protein